MAIIAILFAAPSDAQGWSKLKSSWSDDSEVEIARIIPSLSDTRWGAASGFDDRSLPSSSQPDLRAWLRPSEGSGWLKASVMAIMRSTIQLGGFLLAVRPL